MKKDKNIEGLKKEVKKIEDKNQKLFFFVYDTKGTASGPLAYVYETAVHLKKMGYNVQMLYAGKEFVGVRNWLGDECADLPHFNIEKDEIIASPADFLFIPEICSDVMAQTKSNLNCKRVVLAHDWTYLVDTIPVGSSWETLRIYDCVASNETVARNIKKCFPYANVDIVSPSIPDDFFTDDYKKRNPIINVVTNNAVDSNEIIKAFLWRYPIYQWVPFRNINNISRKELADTFKNSFATIWCDTATNFGRVAVEAMASKNIIIGKIPEMMPEWLGRDNTLNDNGVWFFDDENAVDAVAGVLQSFLTNTIPDTIYEKMTETAEKYRESNQTEQIKKVYVEGLFENRKKELSAEIERLQKQEEITESK